MSLFHYSFLEDYLKDCSFAINLQIQDFTTEETKPRVDNMRIRLSGLCKGLLEPASIYNKEDLQDYNCSEKDAAYYASRDSITFIHRSVYEFLREDPPADMANFVVKFNMEQVIL